MTPTRSPSRSRVRSPRDLEGEHGGQRALDDGHDADEVGAALAGQAQVVDVEDREVGLAGLQEPQRVGRLTRAADVELGALGAVVAARRGHVDAGVHGVGLEVEQERLALPADGALAAAAGRERGRRRGKEDDEEP